MTIDRPRLRNLEAVPQEVDGQLMVILRDARGISDQAASLHPGLAQFLFEVCDGVRTVAEIEAEFERRAGQHMEFAEIFEQLDRALFLESPRYRRRLGELTEEYRQGRTRPVAEIRAYPEEPVAFLDSLYEGVAPAERTGDLRALAIPHLDLRYGGGTAARGLAGLSDSFTGDTVIVLGVGHALGERPYALTGKDFETPVGEVPLDRDLFDRVVGKAGSWLLDEELVHQSEHSLEYAATLLRHALGEREFRFLPVACGSFHEFLAEDRSPSEDPMIDVFLETIAEEAGDALILASVDLAHMGPYYGDDRPLTDRDLEDIATEDREMLDFMARRDAEGFFRCLTDAGDRRRVCGLSALYTLLKLVPEGPEGLLMDYGQPVFPEAGNTVTICSMGWTNP